MNVSPKQEMMMGQLAYRQMLAQTAHAILPQAHPITILVERVARNLIRGAS